MMALAWSKSFRKHCKVGNGKVTSPIRNQKESTNQCWNFWKCPNVFGLGFSCSPAVTGVLHITIKKTSKLCIKAIFRFIDKPTNWYDADSGCRRIGGSLVEIDTPEENQAILGEIRKRGYSEKRKQFWMGLTDRGVSDNVDSLNKVQLLIKTLFLDL